MGGKWSAWLRFATSTDLANYYTKTEINAKFANYYTKSEVDNLISNGGGGGGGSSGASYEFGAVGSYALVTVSDSFPCGEGGSIAGSSLRFSSVYEGGKVYSGGSTPAGTWRAFGNSVIGNCGGLILAARIA